MCYVFFVSTGAEHNYWLRWRAFTYLSREIAKPSTLGRFTSNKDRAEVSLANLVDAHQAHQRKPSLHTPAIVKTSEIKSRIAALIINDENIAFAHGLKLLKIQVY
jgi:hypothetical protein